MKKLLKLIEKYPVIAMVLIFLYKGHWVPRYNCLSRRRIWTTLLQWRRRRIYFDSKKRWRNKNDSNRSFNRRWKRKCTLPCQHMAIQFQMGQGQIKNRRPIIWFTLKSRS